MPNLIILFFEILSEKKKSVHLLSLKKLNSLQINSNNIICVFPYLQKLNSFQINITIDTYLHKIKSYQIIVTTLAKN